MFCLTDQTVPAVTYTLTSGLDVARATARCTSSPTVQTPVTGLSGGIDGSLRAVTVRGLSVVMDSPVTQGTRELQLKEALHSR